MRAPQPADLTVPPPYTQRSDPTSRDIPFRSAGLLSADRYAGTFTEAEVSRGPIKQRRISHLAYCQRTFGEEYASGVATREAKARAMVLSDQQAQTLAHQLVEFRQTVRKLCELDKSFKLSHFEDHLLPPYPRRIGNPARWNWSYLDGFKRLWRRRASVAVLVNLRRSYVLIEIERRPTASKNGEFFQTAIFLPPGRSTSDADIKSLLDFVVERRGVITGGEERLRALLLGWTLNGFWHVDKDIEKRADRLLKKLKSLDD